MFYYYLPYNFINHQMFFYPTYGSNLNNGDRWGDWSDFQVGGTVGQWAEKVKNTQVGGTVGQWGEKIKNTKVGGTLGQWAEQGKAAIQGVQNIKNQFQPCIPGRGRRCTEIIVAERQFIFGYSKDQDIIIRICYPRSLDVEKELEKQIKANISRCMSVALDYAKRDFFLAIAGTSYFLSVGAIYAGITAAWKSFSYYFYNCLRTPEYNGQKIQASIYMDDSPSPYFPKQSPCSNTVGRSS